jgi:hypothetical protein
MTGTILGPWALGPEIGRGPLGVVYKATDTADLQRVAAVKVFTHHAALTPEFLRRFPGEVLPLRQLAHPNIARFIDAGVDAGVGYYATEYIDGTDLATLLKSARRGEPGLNWREVVVPLAVQAARALKHGHHRNTLHRDLKPPNVMLTADGTVKLTDFGIAKALDLSPLTLPADPFGTAGFLAPEFFTGRPLTRKSDLYSLGCVLYAAATGRPPFAAAGPAEYMHKHCYVLPDRPLQFVPRMPPDLDELICALLQKDPNRRPATAAAVLDTLDHIRGRAERKGERVTWPAGDNADPMPTPADAAAADARDDGRVRPLLSRPWVVVPLFLLVLGTALALFFWPRPTAEQLFARARPLLESNDPDQLEQALDEYLNPLSERFPDQYAEEIRAVRARVADHRRLRRAVAEGTQARPRSEAERLYLRGLALMQAGDAGGARRVWGGLAKVYADSEDDRHWVTLATAGVAEADRRGATDDDNRLTAVTVVAERARALTGAEAAALFDVLEQTYRDDPDALEVIRRSRK